MAQHYSQVLQYKSPDPGYVSLYSSPTLARQWRGALLSPAASNLFLLSCCFPPPTVSLLLSCTRVSLQVLLPSCCFALPLCSRSLSTIWSRSAAAPTLPLLFLLLSARSRSPSSALVRCDIYFCRISLLLVVKYSILVGC